MPKICLGEDGFVNMGGGPSYTRDEILSFAKGESFNGIELHSIFETYDLRLADTIKEHYREYDLEIAGVQTGHIGFFYSAISEDEQVRNNYINAVDDAQKFSRAIGSRHCTLTPPLFTSDMKETYDKILERYIDVVSRVIARAEQNDIIMAIEPEPNLVLNGGGLRNSIEDVRFVLKRVSSKNLAVLYDIAHVNVISHGKPVEFLKSLDGRVSWVHVADNDFSLSPFGTGKHQIFGEGNVDMEELFSALKLECSHLEWLQIDTWEHPSPFEAARTNKIQLQSVLSRLNWL